jgi:hypothetical protein
VIKKTSRVEQVHGTPTRGFNATEEGRQQLRKPKPRGGGMEEGAKAGVRVRISSRHQPQPNRHILKLRPPFSSGLAHPRGTYLACQLSTSRRPLAHRMLLQSASPNNSHHLLNDCPERGGRLAKLVVNSTENRPREKTDRSPRTPRRGREWPTRPANAKQYHGFRRRSIPLA